MSIYDDLIANETITSVRNRVIGYAAAAELAITSWIPGDVAEQMLQTFALALYAGSLTISSLTRGYTSLDTSVDPGDLDPYDATNINKDPVPGLLSSFGLNTFFTKRIDATFATGFYTLTNNGTSAQTFGPESLTLTWTANSPPTPAPTYRNVADVSIYTNPGGTVTLAAGDSLTFPVAAEQIGTRSNAPPSSLSLTTTLPGCSGTNAEPVLGTDRESADYFRARCREAPARVSLAGPGDAYRYFAKTNLDGTPLLNGSASPVNITRTYVSQDSTTGIVNVFFASPAGAATSEDVTAANTNIETQCFAVPGCITYTGLAAVEVSLHPVGSGRIRARSGMTTTALQNAVKQAIVAALVAAFAGFPIGGFDQTDGAGVIYTTDLRAIVATAYPGLYDALITTPAGATTPIALGQVATLINTVADWTIAVVP